MKHVLLHLCRSNHDEVSNVVPNVTGCSSKENMQDHDGGDCRTPLLQRTTIIAAQDVDASLPRSLRFLYSLNGLVLSLPSTALLYIVNTRVEVPLDLIAAYGAVAFLPFSFKPLYAYCSRKLGTNMLLPTLLAASGVAMACTAFLDSVVGCFVLAFLRGVTTAWPEFLLGLVLLDHAQRQESFEQAAAVFQSEAATSRNLGSFAANVISFGLFSYRHFVTKSDNELSDEVVVLLLVASGVFAVVGAVVSTWCRVEVVNDDESHDGIIQNSTSVIHDETVRRSFSSIRDSSQEDRYSERQALISADGDGELPNAVSAGNDATFWCLKEPEVCSVILFQLAIIVFAVRSPLVALIGTVPWCIVMAAFCVAVVYFLVRIELRTSRRVGTYLLLKHSIPRSTYLMQSFVYWLFRSKPMLLQILNLTSIGATTLASQSFQRFLAKFSVGWRLLLVIAATTVLASTSSLLNIILVRDRDELFVVVVILISALTTFASEWQFLPGVILATSTVGSSSSWAHAEITHTSEDGVSANNERMTIPKKSAVEYGMLISCIDFGDQIGSWLTMPLVSALGITRENNWKNLTTMIVLCFLAGMASLGLLLLLWRPCRRLK